MGWWSTPPGNASSTPDGYDETQGKMSDVAWVSGDGTIVSLLKKIASAAGGGGGPATIADGADIAQGTTTDAASALTVIGLLKNIKAALGGTLTVGAHNVTNAGTFATQADTELPAAAVITDAEANPTVPRIGSMGMLWNGASWDRAPGTSAAGAKIQSAQLPTALIGGRLDENVGAWLGSTAPTVGSKTSANSVPVVIASDQLVVPISDNAGSLTVDAPVATPVFVRLSDGAAAQIGQKVMASSLPVVIASDQASIPVASTLQTGANRIGSVRVVDSADADQTSAKGTQTSRFIGVQNVTDAGRTAVMLTWEEQTGTAAVESTLANFTLGTKALAVITPATSYTVTAAKTFRIQCVVIYLKESSTVLNIGKFRIRAAASAIANNSTPIFDATLGALGATVASGDVESLSIPIPEGIEVPAGTQVTFTWNTSAATCTVGMTIMGYEY